jgi:hypothetical protein
MFWEELITNFPWYNMDRIQNDVSNNSSIVMLSHVYLHMAQEGVGRG